MMRTKNKMALYLALIGAALSSTAVANDITEQVRPTPKPCGELPEHKDWNAKVRSKQKKHSVKSAKAQRKKMLRQSHHNNRGK